MSAPVLDAAGADVTWAAGTYLAQQAAVRDRVAVGVLAQVGILFDALTGTDDPGVDYFRARVLELVQAGQRQTANASGAYMRAVLDAVPDAHRGDAGTISLPPSLRLDTSTGVDPTVVYQRPLEQWRQDLGARSPSVRRGARAKARQRLMVMVDADMTHAMREGVRQTVAEHPDVIAMRRVPHPELSRGGACGLCIAAADRLYSKRVLMPIHARCQCEPMVVTRDHDPGLELNRADFALLYGDTTDTSAAGLKRKRFRVAEHGEQGPVLVRAQDEFTGPDAALARDEQRDNALGADVLDLAVARARYDRDRDALTELGRAIDARGAA